MQTATSDIRTDIVVKCPATGEVVGRVAVTSAGEVEAVAARLRAAVVRDERRVLVLFLLVFAAQVLAARTVAREPEEHLAVGARLRDQPVVERADDRGVFVMLDSRLPSRLLTAFPPGVAVDRVGLAEAVAAVRVFLEPA